MWSDCHLEAIQQRGGKVGGKQMDQGSSLCGITFLFNTLSVDTLYWAVQQSWFARVNALCNFSCKKS